MRSRPRETTNVHGSATVEWTVASRLEHFPFQVRLDIEWRRPYDPLAQTDDRAFPDAARWHVREGIGDIARDLLPNQGDSLAAQIQLSLGGWSRIDRGTLFVRVARIEATTPDEIVEAAGEYQEAQRRLARQSWDREIRRDELGFVRDLLDDPKLATAWWLSRNDNAIDRLKEVSATFHELKRTHDAESAPAAPPETADSMLARLVSTFLRELDDTSRLHLVQQIPRIFRAYDRNDLAEQLTPRQNGSGPTT